MIDAVIEKHLLEIASSFVGDKFNGLRLVEKSLVNGKVVLLAELDFNNKVGQVETMVFALDQEVTKSPDMAQYERLLNVH